MAYSNNINLPNARAIALKMVLIEKLPLLVVANKCGVHRTTIWRWLKKWQDINQIDRPKHANRVSLPLGKYHYKNYRWLIPTKPAIPLTFPNAIPDWIVKRVLEIRIQMKRCAEVVWDRLIKEGVQISLSSVRRILARNHQYDRPKYHKKLYRRNIKRPLAVNPGDLVQTDTVHLVDPNTGKRKYIYTVIDLATRMAYARVYPKLSQLSTIDTILIARQKFGFEFNVVQADNGGEFGYMFRDRLVAKGISIRHSRPHRPNDNAHVERFNRTLREECIGQYMSSSRTIQQVQGKLDTFLDFYNNDRVHLSLQCQTPSEVCWGRLRRF
jgi:transposase InsO family protein